MQTNRVRLSTNDKITFISNLSTMLNAGIPILEAVDSILEDSKGNQKKVLEVLRATLVQGKQVHFAFAQFPQVFDKVTVNIIKASEEAGTLDVALKDLKLNIRKEMEFTDKIKSAFIYPMFIMVVFSAVLIMILTVVIPKISQVFSSLKVTLPLPTRVLIFMSDGLLHHTLEVILTAVLIVMLGLYLFKTQKRFFVSLLLSLPLISQLGVLIDLTRFSRSLYLLLNAGIPITLAMQLSEEVVNKRQVAIAIAHARESVVSGKKLSSGFKDNKTVIPNMMIKIIEAGERSGSLDKSMQDVSEYFDYQVSESLKLVTALIEPLMLVTVGGLVGGIMLAVIAPMYGIISQVGAH